MKDFQSLKKFSKSYGMGELRTDELFNILMMKKQMDIEAQNILKNERKNFGSMQRFLSANEFEISMEETEAELCQARFKNYIRSSLKHTPEIFKRELNRLK